MPPRRPLIPDQDLQLLFAVLVVLELNHGPRSHGPLCSAPARLLQHPDLDDGPVNYVGLPFPIFLHVEQIGPYLIVYHDL